MRISIFVVAAAIMAAASSSVLGGPTDVQELTKRGYESWEPKMYKGGDMAAFSKEYCENIGYHCVTVKTVNQQPPIARATYAYQKAEQKYPDEEEACINRDPQAGFVVRTCAYKSDAFAVYVCQNEGSKEVISAIRISFGRKLSSFTTWVNSKHQDKDGMQTLWYAFDGKKIHDRPGYGVSLLQTTGKQDTTVSPQTAAVTIIEAADIDIWCQKTSN